jgi:two-component system chemotaxis response regulator CheY
MVRIALENAGYEVYSAGNGEEGLICLDEAGGADLVICDLNMPKVDGIEMLREAKSSEKHRFTPFLMLTTETQKKMREQAREAGARAWIGKPFTEEQLLDAVTKLLR